MNPATFLILLTLFLFPQCSNRTSSASGDPLYIDLPHLARNICEFAVNGRRKNLIREIRPYVHDGRVYFFLLAMPQNRGILRPGFQFSLDLEEQYIFRPRILAVYNGPPGDFISNDVVFVPVAGFAESGFIVITHVFFEFAEIYSFKAAVRLLSGEIN
jgi:hypothetical protein